MRLALTLPLILLVACFEVESDDDGRPEPPGPRGGQEDDTGGEAHDDGGATDGGTGEDGGEEGDGGFEEEEPDWSEACHEAIADWPDAWAAFEEQVVELSNQARARGANCGTYGSYPPVGAVEMDPYLRCAARYHSWWMADTGVFDHYSVGGDLGDDPWERMASAGFSGSGVGENIAAGYSTPAQVVQGWLDSDGHCANLMSSSAKLIGVGYAEGGSYGTWWTQNFGR